MRKIAEKVARLADFVEYIEKEYATEKAKADAGTLEPEEMEQFKIWEHLHNKIAEI